MIDADGGRFMDNPIWSALTMGNSHLAAGSSLAKRFLPEVAPFAAVGDQSKDSLQSLVPLASDEHRVALFTPNQLSAPHGLIVEMQAPILQMVLDKPSAVPELEISVQELNEDDIAAMLDLTTRARPGPFGPRTIEFGRYIGIKVESRLVAMAGERFRFDRFVEISAVSVDPEFRGRGYAAYLIRKLAHRLQIEDITPFLHVFANNHVAIALYEKLGFSMRRQLFVTSMRPSKAEI